MVWVCKMNTSWKKFTKYTSSELERRMRTSKNGMRRCQRNRQLHVTRSSKSPSGMRVRLPDRVALGVSSGKPDGERLARLLRNRLEEPPDLPDMSPETMEARASLLQAAARSLYRLKGDRLPSEEEAIVEIPMAAVPGALLLLLEAGRCDDVISTGKAFMQLRAKPYRGAAKDATITVALAMCELGREALESVPPSAVEARARFQDALELLSKGPYALRKDVQSALEAVEADATIEALARMASETPQSRDRLADPRLKSEALFAVESFLFGKGFAGDGEKAERFFKSISKYLSSGELVAVYERSGVGSKANPALVYEVALAMIAQAWEARSVAWLEEADGLLEKLARDALGGAQEVHIERAICALLLGQPKRAQSFILQPGVDPDVLAFVRKNSRGAADILPGICVLAESWMDEILFPRFRDTSAEYADLNQWFGDKSVALYLEWLEDRNNSPLQKTWHNIKSMLAFAVTPKTDVSSELREVELEELLQATEEDEEATVSEDSVPVAFVEDTDDADLSSLKEDYDTATEGSPEASTSLSMQTTEESMIEENTALEAEAEAEAIEAPHSVPDVASKSSRGDTTETVPQLLKEQMDRTKNEKPVIESFVKVSSKTRSSTVDSPDGYSPSEVEEVLDILDGFTSGEGPRRSLYDNRSIAQRARQKSGASQLASIVLALISLGISGSLLSLGAMGRLKPDNVKRYVISQVRLLRAESLSMSPTPGAQPLPQTSEATASKEVTLLPREKSSEMSKQLAEEVLREWQRIKSLALGGSHEVQLLENILDGPMLSQWRRRAAEVKSHSWYWDYMLVSLKIEKCVTNKEGDKAVIEATIQEAAHLHDPRDPKNGDSYKSTYCAQYELLRQEDGGVVGWKIVGGRVLY